MSDLPPSQSRVRARPARKPVKFIPEGFGHGHEHEEGGYGHAGSDRHDQPAVAPDPPQQGYLDQQSRPNEQANGESKIVGLVSSDVIGWHNMYWSGGQMRVCFRPGGNFFCAEHQAASTWTIIDGEVRIDWQRFGQYVLAVDEGKQMKGHALPRNEADETNWRKTLFFGALSPVEKLLFGDGEGTEWDFQGPGGNFLVEFRCDGINHFVCDTHPGDAHWSLDKKGKTITIDCGKHGKYELDVNVQNKTMDGYQIIDGVEDPDEDKDWRKAEFKRNLIQPKAIRHDEDDGGNDEGHSHSDGHGHGHGHSHGHTHGNGHGEVA